MCWTLEFTIRVVYNFNFMLHTICCQRAMVKIPCHWFSEGVREDNRKKRRRKNLFCVWNISTAGQKDLMVMQIFSSDMQDNERLEWAGTKVLWGQFKADPRGTPCCQKCLRISLFKKLKKSPYQCLITLSLNKRSGIYEKIQRNSGHIFYDTVKNSLVISFTFS